MGQLNSQTFFLVKISSLEYHVAQVQLIGVSTRACAFCSLRVLSAGAPAAHQIGSPSNRPCPQAAPVDPTDGKFHF